MEAGMKLSNAPKAMLAYSCTLLLLATVGGLKHGDRSRDCAVALVKPCIEKLQQLAKNNVIAHASNETLLNSACSATYRSVQCVTAFISNCYNKSERDIYMKAASATNRLMDAICQPGHFRDRFLKHVLCLRLVTINYGHCGHLYEKTVFHMEQGNNRYPTPEACCTYNKLTNCSRTMARKLCDKDGAKFVDEYVELSGDVSLQGNCSRFQLDSALCPRSGSRTTTTFSAGWLSVMAMMLLLTGSGRP